MKAPEDCGCFACRCGLPYACKYEPVPVVFDDSEPSMRAAEREASP